MLFKSALVTQVSGSIGGMTGSHNRGGLYFRARAIPTDPNTPFQAAVRSAFAAVVPRWLQNLTQAQREDWEVYGINTTIPGPLGDPIKLSGQQQFVRSNVIRSAFAQPLVLDAPVVFDTGALGLMSITNATEAAQTLDVNFVNTDDWANEAGGFLYVFISRPQNESINFFRGPYRFQATINGDPVPPTSPVTMPTPFAFVEGQRLYARARASLADGRLTTPGFLGPTLAVA